MRTLLVFAVCGCSACGYDFGSYTPVEGSDTTDTSVNDTAVGDTGAADGAAPEDTGTTSDVGADAVVPCMDTSGIVFEGHCYFPLPSERFDRARDSCVARGAHLVTITSAAEAAFVEAIRPGRDRWIGLSRPVGSASAAASFQWITAETFAYTNWGTGEPSGSGLCVRLRGTNIWDDRDCTDSNDVICERE
jgi:hypothetical protein